MEENDLTHIYDVSLFNLSDLDVLLHEILKHTRDLLNAEAGTIYISNKEYLKFHVFQNDALSYEDIYRIYHSFKDFKFPLTQYEKYLAVDSYLLKKIILVDDVYASGEYDFYGIKDFDKKYNYKTHSMITVPLIHPIDNDTLGVVQLINKKEDDKFTKFSIKDKEILSMFSSFMALSISKAQTDIEKLQNLNKKLKDANENLEKKVQEEIQKNEDKSAIIFHQSKMASMGELIGNIAHQWRQPLSTISTIASGISLDLQFDDLDKENSIVQLGRIVNTTKDLSLMIEDFRSFYDVNTAKENFNISKTIYKSLEIAEVILISNKVKVILNLDESLNVYGLKNEFTQSILNILTNAKDALNENIELNENKFVFIDLYKDHKNTILKIRDNANGIPLEVSKNIFKQNYTTKGKSTGTGIGLFMSRLIIEKHMDGKINFANCKYIYNNVEYLGAEFTIILA